MRYEVYEYDKKDHTDTFEIKDASLDENIWKALKPKGMYKENLIIDNEESSSYCVYIKQVFLLNNKLIIKDKYKIELIEEDL